MTDAYRFYLGQPWWLAAGLVIIPMLWLAGRSLTAVGAVRRTAAMLVRAIVVLLLAVLLARPMLVQEGRRTTVIAVLDRSRSIPAGLAEAALDYLSKAVALRQARDQLAVVDVAETATISMLPCGDTAIRRRNTDLTGVRTRLADGIQMAMAIAPPDTAARIVLVSEGNETEGDLTEAARTAAANGIPIDVLPLRYRYDHEVLFRRVVAPPRVRSGQAIPLRLLLDSTAEVRGRLLLTLNGDVVDLAPDAAEVSAPVELKAGTNVKTVSVPAEARGIHEFEAVFQAEDPGQDRIAENNRATAMVSVVGPGAVRVFDTDGLGAGLTTVLQRAGIIATRAEVSELPTQLTHLLDADAVLLVNTPVHPLTLAQQEMLCRYVNDLGGGLVMVGGPDAFGAGGWIGSPVAAILPVDLDPPQKRQLPLGALVLVLDHSGSMTGEKVEICKAAAAGAVRLLSRRDQVGIVVFEAVSEWLVPLGPAEDKEEICRRIGGIGAGGGTIMAPAMEKAFAALKGAEADVRHVVLLTDGQTAEREVCAQLGRDLGAAGITVSTIAVGPDADTQLLHDIAASARGRFYPVAEPRNIPEIFIKEAQVVRRSMIVEETFSPQIVTALAEILQGVPASLPALDGYVVTAAKGGLSQLILAGNQGDPVLAACQSGLGRCVAFTSSADSRWAAQWVQWPEFSRFWEQVVRWAARPSPSAECEILTDVEGQEATVRVAAYDAEGRSLHLGAIEGQVLTPEMTARPLRLIQTGPGQYSGRFRAPTPGSYVVNLQVSQTGAGPGVRVANAIVTIPFAPEFRDLSDNTPLLEEVSKMTRGRVLRMDSDPNHANLYDPVGLRFPHTHLPLTRPLMLVWIAMFLVDVAVRRLAWDGRALLRRIRAVPTSSRRGQKDERISRLQAARQRVRSQWSTKAAQDSPPGRVDAGRADGTDPGPGRGPDAEAGPVEGSSAQQAPSARTHIDRLLQAKRGKTGQKGTDTGSR